MSGRIFSSFTVGRFTIIPAGDPPPQECGIPIILGKKGAFGSGEHETTAACLDILPEIPVVNGCSALDLGSGTGVLAIAAARLGASRVAAVDLEWPAARSCSENVRLNGLEDRIFSVCGELAAVGNGCYDLVLANIYEEILTALADQLVQMTRSAGYLLLSGIPLQDKFEIVRCYTSRGCAVVDSRIGEDFATYLLQRR